jgi:uridine kinase
MINPNNADIIFYRKRPIFEKILAEIERRKDKNKPFVVGISGIDGAGKTSFAEDLESFLVDRGLKTQAIYLDDFHNPKEIRYAGKDPADNYFNRSFNISLIVAKLLKPLRRKRAFSTRMTVLDYRTDRYDTEREFTFGPDTIVIFEGVFLFRKELAPYIDYKIHLDITFEESKRRAKERDPEAILEKYDEKYLPAQTKYLKEYPPDKTADMVIDNSDWQHPKINFSV